MKKIIFLALAVIFFSAIHAQTGNNAVSFGGGIRLAFPTGDCSDAWGFGVGGEL